MRRLLILIVWIVLFTGCTNDCPDGLCATEACPFCPDVVLLSFPENNQACEPGTILSDSLATVTLQWQYAKDADTYEVVITNQASGELQTFSNLSTNEQVVTLERAQAYSWYVTSFNQRANITQTSTMFQFYLQGEGIVNYAPFAPTLLTPEPGKSIEATQVNFSWQTTDLDGDTLSYTLFVDTVDGKQTPPVAQQNLSQTSFTLELESGKVYYYRVEAFDGKNRASSITRSFRTK